MATNTTTTALDAAGRPIAVGDTVGGTTSGRYQATIIGPVVKLGKDQVKVQVSNAPGRGTLRPSDDDQVWISTRRVFLISAASQTAQAYQAAADLILHWHGPAPDVYSPQDSAALLLHVAQGGNPADTTYPDAKSTA